MPQNLRHLAFRTLLWVYWVIQADGHPLRDMLQRLVPGKRILRDEITGDRIAVQPADAEIVIRLTTHEKRVELSFGQKNVAQ